MEIDTIINKRDAVANPKYFIVFDIFLYLPFMAIFSLRLPKIVLVENGVNTVFGEEKTSIFKPTYEWGEG